MVNVNKSVWTEFGLSNFVLYLNKLIDDSTKYFHGSYYLEEILNNSSRINCFEEELKLLEKHRKFDSYKLELIQKYYANSVENSLLHMNEDLYFGVIYTLLESLKSKLIEISEAKSELDSIEVSFKEDNTYKIINTQVKYQRQSFGDCLFSFFM